MKILKIKITQCWETPHVTPQGHILELRSGFKYSTNRWHYHLTSCGLTTKITSKNNRKLNIPVIIFTHLFDSTEQNIKLGLIKQKGYLSLNNNKNGFYLGIKDRYKLYNETFLICFKISVNIFWSVVIFEFLWGDGGEKVRGSYCKQHPSHWIFNTDRNCARKICKGCTW